MTDTNNNVVEKRSDQSQEIGELAKALAIAQGEFKPVLASQEADMGGKYSYNYADLAIHYEATRPALTKNGLSVIQTLRVAERGNILVATLVHSSGQWMKSELCLPPAGKAQEFGTLMTYYRRYQYSALVGTATEDDDAQNEAPSRSAPRQPEFSNGSGGAQTKRVTEKQLGRLYAIARGKGWNRDQVVELVQTVSEGSAREPADLNWAQYDVVCKEIEAKPKGPEDENQDRHYAPPEAPVSQESAPAAPPLTINKTKMLTPIQANSIKAKAKEHNWPSNDLASYLSTLAGITLKSVNGLPSSKFDEAMKFIEAHPYPKEETK